MGPIQATVYCMMHPFRWDARGTRSEFWGFSLVCFLASFGFFAFLFASLIPAFGEVLVAVEAAGAYPTPEQQAAIDAGFFRIVGEIYQPLIYFAVVSIWPSFATLAATVRRFHDSGHSGWWYFISLVPFIGIFWYLILLILPSSDEKNEWGPPPSGPGFERRREKAKARREAALEAYMQPRSEIDVHDTPEAIRALRLARTPGPVGS